MRSPRKIAIIGGGAAGFFCAINLAKRFPKDDIVIYEASNKLLAKVLVSGGGRCNVTNAIHQPEELILNYPRGSDFLLPLFSRFSSKDTVAWFEREGVSLKTEEDGRIFPVSNSSATIYNCFLQLAKKYGISILLSHRLLQLEIENKQWLLRFKDKEEIADKVIICSGSNIQIWKLLTQLDLKIVPPLPSLFTFNAAEAEFSHLAGISVPLAKVRIKNEGSKQEGPLLITHKGFSGPAILRLSAWEALKLATLNYHFDLVINWLANEEAESIRKEMMQRLQDAGKEKISLWAKSKLPSRLWLLLLKRAKIPEYANWSEIGKKGVGRLLDQLFACELKISGKSTFKEEFVTTGGLYLLELNPHTLESKKYPGLYFAGEVLNIDAITGGFNFQAAWTAAYVIAESV